MSNPVSQTTLSPDPLAEYTRDEMREACRNNYASGALHAYKAACRVVDRDHKDGVFDQGIIDNILAELARLAGVK